VRQHAGAAATDAQGEQERAGRWWLTVPRGCRLEEADRFLKKHIDWVRERLGRVPEPVPLADGATIPLRGDLHRIRFPSGLHKALAW
jgi:predicted metal-dependent hydrolase